MNGTSQQPAGLHIRLAPDEVGFFVGYRKCGIKCKDEYYNV
jgi:hypothetical protein